MSGLSSQLSARFVNMGFVCACLVVLIHVGFSPVEGSPAWWLGEMFTTVGVTRIAVPWFFLTSGFFLMRAYEAESGVLAVWRTSVFKRLRSVLVPYAVWNGAYAALVSLLVWAASRGGYEFHLNFDAYGLSWRGIANATGLNIGVSPILHHLWYLRCLMLYVLIAPIVVWLVRCRAKRLIMVGWFAATGLVLAASPHEWYEFWRYSISLDGLFFFAFGMYLAHETTCRLLSLRRGSGVLLAVSGLVLFATRAVLAHTGGHFTGECVAWLAIGATSFGLFALMPARRVFPTLTAQSFPIYLLHQFVLLPMAGLIGYLGLRDVVAGSIALYFIRGVLVIGISVGISLALRKILPRFSALAFGGR